MQVGLDFLAPRTEFDQIYPGVLQAYVYDLLALVGLFSVRTGAPRLIKGRWRFVVHGVTWSAALWVAAQILKSAAGILILIHRAVMGSVWSIPGLRRDEWSMTALSIEGDRFYAVAQVGVLAALIAVVLVAALARQWRMPHWRLALLAAALAAVAATIGITTWLSTTGLTAASPFFVEMPILPAWHCTCMVISMLLIVTTVTACRIVGPLESAPHVAVVWRRHTNVYLHQWHTVSLLLAVTAIGNVAHQFRDLQWSNYLQESMILAASQPETLMSLSVFLVAVRGLFARHRQSPDAGYDDPRTLLLARFLCVWLVTLAVFIPTAITCRWLAFGMWLSE